MSRAAVSFLVAVRRVFLLGLVWFALAGADPDALLPGLAAVAGAAWLSLRLLPPGSPVRLWRAALLLPPFVWRSLVGGADVARRALDPRMPLAPGWVETPCRLPGGAPALLGGALSLMPGSLAAGTRGGRLLVHCLDAGRPVAEEIAADEAALARALGSSKGAPKP